MMQRARFKLSVAAAVCLLAAGSPRAGIFDDDEARKAIIDLRQRITAADDASKARSAEQAAALAQLTEQITALRRSLLDLNNQLEGMRGDVAKLRGTEEQLTRDVTELQRRQKDASQAIDDRLRRIEPVKASVDGRDFMVDPEEKKAYDDAIATLRAATSRNRRPRFRPFSNAIRPAATSIRFASGSATRSTASTTTKARSPPFAPSSPPRPTTRARPKRCSHSPTRRPR